MKKRYRGLNDKRHYCGKLAPNLFFLFEILIVLELAWVVIKVLEYLGLETSIVVVLIVSFFAAMMIGKFWKKRHQVINRQKGRCPEEDEAG